MRLAPQGITGTNYLEVDYVDPPPPVLPIDWKPDNVYIPSAPSTVSQLRQRRAGNHRPPAQARHRGHGRQPQQADGHRQRPHGGARHRRLSKRADAALGQARNDARRHRRPRSSPTKAQALMAELRTTNAELQKMLANPALQKLPDDASAALARIKDAGRRSEARARARTTSSRTMSASRPHHRRRRSRPGDDDRQPAADHRQPARPDRGHQALSVEPDLRRGRHLRWSASHDVRPSIRRRAQRSSRWLRWRCIGACIVHAAAAGEASYLLEPACAAAALPRRSRDRCAWAAS